MVYEFAHSVGGRYGVEIKDYVTATGRQNRRCKDRVVYAEHFGQLWLRAAGHKFSHQQLQSLSKKKENRKKCGYVNWPGNEGASEKKNFIRRPNRRDNKSGCNAR